MQRNKNRCLPFGLLLLPCPLGVIITHHHPDGRSPGKAPSEGNEMCVHRTANSAANL